MTLVRHLESGKYGEVTKIQENGNIEVALSSTPPEEAIKILEASKVERVNKEPVHLYIS
ncbi:MAG: hypothetical protein QXQ39_07165 [Conexivisphaerales archaeon]